MGTQETEPTPVEPPVEPASENPPAEPNEAEAPVEPAEEVDWRAKFEAQQKINRDLERKVKHEAAPLKAEIEQLRAKVEGTEAEHQAAVEAQRVKDEAIAAANTRILKAEIRAVAANKLQDPKDALLHLNLSEFEVDSDGEVDASQIAEAIDDLIKEKPYLAAQGGKRFQGGADGGARNDATKPSQLTADEVKRMSPEEIDVAEAAGRLDRVLGRT